MIPEYRIRRACVYSSQLYLVQAEHGVCCLSAHRGDITVLYERWAPPILVECQDTLCVVMDNGEGALCGDGQWWGCLVWWWTMVRVPCVVMDNGEGALCGDGQWWGWQDALCGDGQWWGCLVWWWTMVRVAGCIAQHDVGWWRSCLWD